MISSPQSAPLRVLLTPKLSSDHVSPAPGVTLTVTISINGGAFQALAGGSGAVHEVGSGLYYADLNATDTGTWGPLIVRWTGTGIDPGFSTPVQIVNMHNGGFDALPNAAANTKGGLASTVLVGFTSGLQSQAALQPNQFLGSSNDSTTVPMWAYGAQIVLFTPGEWQVRNIVSATISGGGVGTLYQLDSPLNILPDNTTGYVIVPGNGSIPASLQSIYQEIMQSPLNPGAPSINNNFTAEQALSLIVANVLAKTKNGNATTYFAGDGTKLVVSAVDNPSNPTTITRTA